jgi:hypothetical protein
VCGEQNDVRLTLKIDLRQVQDAKVELTDTGLKFECSAQGTFHAFEMEFFKEIDAQKSTYTVTQFGVNVVLIKKERGGWSRVLKQEDRQRWLKVDFAGALLGVDDDDEHKGLALFG